jgi:hypothetical protein
MNCIDGLSFFPAAMSESLTSFERINAERWNTTDVSQ